jgi:RecA-family ATPase
MMDLKAIARALGGEVSNGEVRAPGPGHSSIDRSLSVKLDSSAPDGFLTYSFAGDDPIICRDHVRAKAGLEPFKPNGNFANNEDNEDRIAAAMAAAMAAPRAKPKGTIVATFDYTDADGTLLYQVLKYDPKNFSQQRPDGHGGWIKNLDGVRRVLYRWPELLKYPDATVHFCEGEKDADTLAAFDLCATTIASGKWTDDCVQALAGRNVWIFEDRDEAGGKRSLEAAERLHPVAASIKIIRLPGLTGEENSKDVTNWLVDMGHSKDELYEVNASTLEWEPSDTSGDTKENNKPIGLPFIDMSNWDNEAPPPREWAVHDRIPLRQVTLFSGEGAAGKSTVQLHLSAAHPLGRDWLGTLPTLGPSMFVDAEDDKDELHRRLDAVTRHYGVTYNSLINGGLHLVSLAGEDAVLATTTKGGKVEPTPRYFQLLEAAGDIKPKIIGVASSANVFAGDENSRPEVQQFIGFLTRIAIVANGGLCLISHPSLTGINTDTGISGSTQWHNGVRARFYMKGVKSGEQSDNDLREIVFKKNNYGPISETIVLRYRNGLFLPVAAMGSLEKIAADQAADDLFLDMLEKFQTQGRKVSHNATSNNYAPKQFAEDPQITKMPGIKRTLAQAMQRLFAAGKIKSEDYGKPSNPHHHLVKVGPK